MRRVQKLKQLLVECWYALRAVIPSDSLPHEEEGCVKAGGRSAGMSR